MTLCLAWKQRGDIYFASDSRLTEADKSVVTDDATKIFKVGVEIFGPVPSETPDEPEELIHQTTFGICFAGSYLNGSILADTIEEVLSNIQASPYSDISIENLSDIAFAIYKQVSAQLMQIHREKGLSKVLIGGYCPTKKEFKLYQFSPKDLISGQALEFEKQEITLTNKPVFIGDSSAIKKAEELLEKVSKDYTYFHLLREIIQDETIKTVGGNIQCGLFRHSNFKTYGIIEYSLYENEYKRQQVKDDYKFRGLSLNFDDNELRKGDINIHKTFFNPFESERQMFFKQILENNDIIIDTPF